MSLRMIKNTIISTIIGFGVFFTGQVQAHGGLALAEDMCVLTVGPYKIHFTGYQPLSQEEEFCEDIPEIGKTVVALDYINDELRPMETEVRIVRSATIGTPQDYEKVPEKDLEDMTVYHLPPKVYPNASITMEHIFPEKGKFAGVVTVSGGDQEHVSVFPFSVGEGRPIDWLTVAPAIAIIAAIAFFFLRSRRKPEDDVSAA